MWAGSAQSSSCGLTQIFLLLSLILQVVDCKLVVPQRLNTSKTKFHHVVDAFLQPHPPLDDPTLALLKKAFEAALSRILSSSPWPLLPLLE